MFATSTMGATEATGRLTIVIAGGGTGGHLFPGIAIAKEIQRRRPDARISFAGTKRGIEARVVPLEGFALDLIRSAGLKGKSIVARARGAALLPLSFGDAWRIISTRRPQLVVGVGGYSSGPVVLVASLRGVPTMLLEQNAVPGLTNRLLAPFVRAAAVTFESTAAFFGPKAFISGNPVRPEFLNNEEQPAESGDAVSASAQVLVFGGSQGAHAINMAMVEAAQELTGRATQVRLTHQTGERDLEVVRAAYRQASLTAEVAPFFIDMGRRLREADLVVCRAGATTVAEITAAGKPAILVPLPTATDDHQRKNAEALAAAGAADVLIQAEMSGHVLAQRILTLAGDRAKRLRMAAVARTMAHPHAARVIVDRALELAERTNRKREPRT
ncbi:MAG: undecaprenyldiphospho-muramoylpentapeptide beta-N-acetylglucosaminyltransferase [Blastocatellia bacterium]|nr:MAG: undecaprenyldiphospho-muramoylpentapeptide beta-N-acetylglucosaminyltransferase [Blastocatellia bacterium]